MTDFSRYLVDSSDTPACLPLIPVLDIEDPALHDSLDAHARMWAKNTGFDAKAGTLCPVPAADGGVAAVLFGVEEGWKQDPWSLAGIMAALEDGDYHIDGLSGEDACILGWLLAAYRFTRYKDTAVKSVRLVLPDLETGAVHLKTAEAIGLVRDLINTPTEDMGPHHLQHVMQELATEFGGSLNTVVGDDLLTGNFPAIHAVGRAAAPGREPRLMDLTWGDTDAPGVTLVGKGVCFDTGGLDLKSSQFMRLMKKDMGGAAHVIGLGRLIMATGLKVRLRILVPAVENAVDGNAFRPGDVLDTRRGLTVEVGNTDAEGRLILCDALTLACEDKPDLLIDYATLTGAARVALGPDLPATFAADDATWTALEKAAKQTDDPLWRLPLYAPYVEGLKSDIADLSNIAEGGFAGAITAALYLQKFVDDATDWVHIDVFGWNPKPVPGRPKGGDAGALRAVYQLIRDRAVS